MDIGAAHDHLQGMMAARPILSRRPNSLLGPRPKDIPKAQRVPLVDIDHLGRNGLLRYLNECIRRKISTVRLTP